MTTAIIERLTVKNFRSLADIDIKKLTPLTVLTGPNGSGKSTVFDVFAFLSECFEGGLRRAWDRRGKAAQLRTRGRDGPVVIEIKYREQRKPTGGNNPLITYHIEIDEEGGKPFVPREWLSWKRKGWGRPFHFMDYSSGTGSVVSGEFPDEDDRREDVPLSSSETLAVNVLGQLAKNPRVAALRNFVTGWHLSYLSTDEPRLQPETGPQEQLSRTGGNLANVIQHLSEHHRDRLQDIFKRLRQRVPRIDNVTAKPMPDGRLLLQIKDAPFDDPIMARFASDGTLKILAYLVLLHDPEKPPFLGIEEPENFLHPRLLYGLAEECRDASAASQILATTHSPFFLDALNPEEVRVLWRDAAGHTQCHPIAADEKIKAFIKEGAQLGDLWMEGQFGVGDPLTRSGAP
ncbi:MAG: AAA family ATPase [Hyphomonadaceae bacterium]|nr:AAA family ATPase [Hyphomonadaceae bacterium]MBC6412560.1 AAA family ATPase [Hyphomonadaceae bacterium]